jgi:ribokinase
MGNIVVIGSINMDMVVTVDEMPKKGQTVMGKSLEMIPGGKGANQAYAAAKLGARISMIGAVGDDDNSDVLIRNLKTAGVDVSGIDIWENRHCGTAFILVSSNGDNQIVVIPGTNYQVRPETIDKKLDLIKACDIVVMQLEIPIESVVYASALAKENGKVVILDPAPAPAQLPDELLRNIDILTPNETELEILTGSQADSIEGVVSAARKLVDSGIKDVIVTLGGQGAVLVNEDCYCHKPAYEFGKVVDTTAAGDCFTAALAVAYGKNKPLEQAIEFAGAAAAISVTRKGAQPSIPGLSEVNERLAKI